MTWHTISWTADQGTGKLVEGIELALTAHPAWEFVEETIESQYGGPDGAEFVMNQFPCRVWRSLSTANGLGEDFYIALVPYQQRQEATDAWGEGGYFFIFGAEDYDIARHAALNHVGKAAGWSYTQPFNADGTWGEQNALGYYPWLANHIDDEGTFGSWGTRYQTLGEMSSEEMNNNSNFMHPMSQTQGTGLSFPSWYATDETIPTTALTAVLRVSNQGILLMIPGNPDNGDTVHDFSSALYVGLLNQNWPDPDMENPFPLAHYGGNSSMWSTSFSSSLFVMSRYPGISDRSDSSSNYRLSPPYWYYWGASNDASGAATDREKFPMPKFGKYLVVPFGPQPGEDFNMENPTSLFYQIPGVWLFSAQGVPDSWITEDALTATSPDGGEAILARLGGSSWGSWFAIDKEIS